MGVLCVQIIQLSTLYTHQLVTVKGSAKSDSNPRTCALGGVWKENMTGMDLKDDAATMAAYPVSYFPCLFVCLARSYLIKTN